MTFSLRDTVRVALADTKDADPGVIATAVFATIPPEEYGEALSQTLRLFVRQVISEQRGTRQPPRSNVRQIRPSSSWKGQAIREGWQRHLDDRLHVGNSEWKLLRHCTADDLLAVAAERQEKAERNSAWARAYRAFAEAVNEADVQTFGDLPAEAQMNLLGAVA